MIDAHTYGVFVIVALAIIAAPGPDILYVLSQSLSAGRRIGVISAFGIASGEVVHTLLVVVGLAALLQASIAAFLVLKYVGAVYLIYLGIRMIRDRSHVALPGLGIQATWKVFRQGLLTNIFNPKAILFYVTFLPQFVHPARGHARNQLIVLGIAFAVLDVIFLSALAGCVGRVNRWMTRTPRNQRGIRWVSGSLLVGLGVRVAFTEGH